MMIFLLLLLCYEKEDFMNYFRYNIDVGDRQKQLFLKCNSP